MREPVTQADIERAQESLREFLRNGGAEKLRAAVERVLVKQEEERQRQIRWWREHGYAMMHEPMTR